MTSRGKWATQQQDLLKELRERQGFRSWKKIALTLNTQFPGLAVTGKQCRERYVNFVRFTEENSKSTMWTAEDDQNFTTLFLEFGAKWSEIVKCLPEKSQNCVKNRFYGGLRRIIRQINRVEKFHRIGKTKPIRYETLIRILTYEQTQKEINSQCEKEKREFGVFLRKLKLQLLSTTWDLINGHQTEPKMIGLVEEIHEFNARVRGLTFMNSLNQEKPSQRLAQPRNNNKKQLEASLIDTDTPQKSSSWEEISFLSMSGFRRKTSNYVGERQKRKSEKGFLLDPSQIFMQIEKKPNYDEFDYEVCRIFQQDYVPQTFYFFQ